MWRKQVTDKRPYRCSACGWRGWRSLGLSDQPPPHTGTLLRFDEAKFTDEKPLHHLDRLDLDKLNRLRP
jgi:hypothetical protein